MKKLLAILLMLALLVVAVGFYRGWFGLSMDTDKMSEDAKALKNQVGRPDGQRDQ